MLPTDSPHRPPVSRVLPRLRASGCRCLHPQERWHLASAFAPTIRKPRRLDALRWVAGEPPPQLRLFLGYAGWGPGQLEAELAAGAWVLAPFAHEPIFAVSEDELWAHVWRLLGIDPATVVSTPGIH